ncbi:MAG: hypothetical protein OXN96_21480 [Bryobacterales bacterium]|nr:hypothetical protein [Bryobacterales bacterium]
MRRQQVRVIRPALLALVIIAGIAAWPQEPFLPAVDHSQHPMIEVDDAEPTPSMRIHMDADSMDGFNIFLETQNFRFTPQSVDTLPVSNEGHAHLYVNGEKVARMYSPWHHLSSKLLRDGINRLEVEFSTNDHSVWAVAGVPIGADVLIDTAVMEGDPILREDVRYTLDWDWGAASPHQDGGWTVRTDRGYHVQVDSGQIVSRNLELVPCHVAPPPPPQASILGWPSPSRVFAGHSSLIPNESKITASYVEDLATPQEMFLERRVVTDPEYCQAHYLLARERGSPPGSLTLDISGTWSKSSEKSRKPFNIKSAAAYGEFKPLQLSDGVKLGRRLIVGGIDARVRRSLDTLFNGIDFADDTSDSDGMQVLRNLVAGTSVLVSEVEAPSAGAL